MAILNTEYLNKWGGTSKYRGVHYHKLANKWEASIRVGGKRKYLGLFKDELDAAKVHDSVKKLIQQL